VSKCSASNPKPLLDGEGGEDPVLRVFTSFQSTHTIKRLLTEHQTIEAAMKALEEGYEKVVTFQSVGVDHMQLLDRRTALGNLTAFYHAQKIQLASIAYSRAQGFAKPVASQHLLNYALKLAVEQQMRPFRRLLDFLRWITHISRPSSPLQALRGLSPHFSVLYRNLSALVDDLSHHRAFLALENGFKKRYATTKYELETLIRKTLRGNAVIKGLIIRRPQCLYPPIHLHMYDQLGISRHTLEALIDIRMRRVSSRLPAGHFRLPGSPVQAFRVKEYSCCSSDAKFFRLVIQKPLSRDRVRVISNIMSVSRGYPGFMGASHHIDVPSNARTIQSIGSTLLVDASHPVHTQNCVGSRDPWGDRALSFHIMHH
jgi:hypothetical protein